MEIEANKLIDALTQQNALLNRELIMRDIVIAQLQEELANAPDGTAGSTEQDAGSTKEANAGNGRQSGNARPVLKG